MRIIYNENTEPYYNLAAEEFFLRGEGDIFIIWRNGKSVIIGKNQNAYSEVNLSFCREKGIKLARRLTGGGAVFHDLGNINYTFITDGGEGGIDFERFTVPVCKALKKMGIDASLSGRNDLICENMKISGNAQCLYDTPAGRKRLLHHGTLLFSADTSYMAGALNVSPEKLASKGIKSVPSRVKNIKSFSSYTGKATAGEFAEELVKFAEREFSEKRQNLSAEERGKIKALAEEKYSRWDFIFGQSKKYSALKKKRFPCGEIEIAYTADRGVIEEIKISGDFFSEFPISELEKHLRGRRLAAGELTVSGLSRYIFGALDTYIEEVILY